MPDHIYLFISAPPTIAPTELVKILKSVSSNEMFKAFPSLKKISFGVVDYGAKDIISVLLGQLARR